MLHLLIFHTLLHGVLKRKGKLDSLTLASVWKGGCPRDLQVPYLETFSLKLGLRALFTHLKIILLQYFQFSTISSIQTDPFIVRVEIISIRYYNYFICFYVREKKMREKERERERERGN